MRVRLVRIPVGLNGIFDLPKQSMIAHVEIRPIAFADEWTADAVWVIQQAEEEWDG